MEMRWLAEYSKIIILIYIMLSSMISGMYSSAISIDDILSGKGDGMLLQSSILFGLLNGIVCIILYNISEK